MAEIVNLRAARKRKQRDEKERRAEENRARHGRTKVEKLAEAAERERGAAALDGHRREPSRSRGESGPDGEDGTR